MKNVLLAMIATATISVAQADCNPFLVSPTTPTNQFIDNNDGTIMDMRTGLLWAKCSLGQVYDNNQCNGAAETFDSLSTALTAADDIRGDYLGQDGWRIPNIKELDSIIERACTNPAINVSVFPGTASATYVSSTPDDNSADGSNVHSISFATGEEFTPPTETLRLVRLVKYSD